MSGFAALFIDHPEILGVRTRLDRQSGFSKRLHQLRHLLIPAQPRRQIGRVAVGEGQFVVRFVEIDGDHAAFVQAPEQQFLGERFFQMFLNDPA